MVPYSISECNLIGLTLVRVNNRPLPSIWVFAGNGFLVSNVYTSEQHVKVEVWALDNRQFISFIYGSNSSRFHRDLWTDLPSLSIDSPWLLVGEFNVVRGAHEKTGENINLQACHDFVLFSDNVDVSDLPLIGAIFTWSNGRRGTEIFNVSSIGPRLTLIFYASGTKLHALPFLDIILIIILFLLNVVLKEL